MRLPRARGLGPALAATLKATLLFPADDARLERSRTERAYLGQPTGPVADALQMALDDGRVVRDFVGYSDTRLSELQAALRAHLKLAADAPMWPDFEEGWKVSRVLDAIALSHREGRWLNVNDIV